jgi:cyanophycin synthetase
MQAVLSAHRASDHAAPPTPQLVAGAPQAQHRQAVPGHLFGLAQPSLRVRLRWLPGGDVEALVTRLVSALAPHLPGASGQVLLPLTPHSPAAPPWLSAIAELVHLLQTTAGLTVLPQAFLLEAAEGHATLALPGPFPAAVSESLSWVLAALNALALDPLASELPPTVLSAQAVLHKQLVGLAPGGTNQKHLIRVAYALGMPVLALPGEVVQFGWGSRSRLFRSTLSDATSSIATAWAKNKNHTNALLRMAGLPVPEQVVVVTLEAAVSHALRIGYPVVLKPINLDQGTGVEAGLRNEAELRSAHVRASRFGNTLLLEKHVLGDDHRVNVMQCEVVGVARRTPARVTGDGVNNVADLVAAANRERRVLAVASAMFKPIELDAEALELLAREGMDVQSVPAAGSVITLRRTANVSRGGSTEDLTDKIHPDNAALCVQAAALLRLDIAGLDLLITDISRSWREVGGAFCEINAQPQTGGAHPWMFEKILKRFVVGRGRVPSVLVLGKPGQSAVAGEIVVALSQTGLRTAQVQGSGLALLQNCRAQLMAPDLGALVVVTDGADLLRWGLPLDRFDVLVVDAAALPCAQIQATWSLLEPHVSTALVNDAAMPHLDSLQQRWGKSRVRVLAGAGELVRSVMETLAGLPDGG